MSNTSARPAAAIPNRKTTSRRTKNAEKTRPRISRGVLRWSRVDRAIADGALKKPEIVTIRIATPTWLEMP